MKPCAVRSENAFPLTAALLLGCLTTNGAAAADAYVVTNLGTLGGGGSHAAAVNNAGQVVGSSYSEDGVQHAFLYDDGQITDLGTLGGANSFATAINNTGQIVGYSDVASTTAQHATLWIGATVIDLGTLGGNFSFAYGINDAGEVVGSTSTAIMGPHAARWIGTSATDLGTNIAAFSVAHGINASGQVVGQQNNPEPLAYVWNGTVASELSSTNLGDGTSDAAAINALGEAVGQAQVSALPLAPAHAVRWDSTAATSAADLGTLGGVASAALGINAMGQIVGWADTATGAPHATLWIGDRATDLNQWLSPTLVRYVVLTDAAAINDHGWIVADGIDSRTGETDAYLLVPRSAACGADDHEDRADSHRQYTGNGRSGHGSSHDAADRGTARGTTVGTSKAQVRRQTTLGAPRNVSTARMGGEISELWWYGDNHYLHFINDCLPDTRD